MSSCAPLTVGNMDSLRRVVSAGFKAAAENLTVMVDKKVKVTSPGLSITPIGKVPKMFGQGDELVVAIYLAVSGGATGHIMLIFSPPAANELAAMLMGSNGEQESGLDEMGRSALAELGNIIGSAFLAALSDATGLNIKPSPPYLIADMAGAALNVPLVTLAMSMDDVLTIDTRFTDKERRIGCLFLMLPDAASLDLVLGKLGASNG